MPSCAASSASTLRPQVGVRAAGPIQVGGALGRIELCQSFGENRHQTGVLVGHGTDSEK